MHDVFSLEEQNGKTPQFCHGLIDYSCDLEQAVLILCLIFPTFR